MLAPGSCVTLVIWLQGALFLHLQSEDSSLGTQALHGHTVSLIVQKLRMAFFLHYSSLPVANLCLPHGMHNKRDYTQILYRCKGVAGKSLRPIRKKVHSLYVLDNMLPLSYILSPNFIFGSLVLNQQLPLSLGDVPPCPCCLCCHDW